METTEYDYVIVGAGSAGCVLARRLTEDPGIRVLLLEVGGADDDPTVAAPIAMPVAFPTLFGGPADWAFSAPAPNGAPAGTPPVYLPRGRVLGGSSSLNAMIYIRGNAADYDGWRDGGAPGWGYRDVLPYFVRAEANCRLGPPFHGTDGPLHVEDPVFRHELSQAWVASVTAAGVAPTDDFNGAEQRGAGFYQTTTHHRRRWSTARGYLAPARDRDNLTVRTGALVETVVIDRGRARGVRYHTGDGPAVAEAAEVVVCGGAISSPHLLMRSGIGPADHLRAHGVVVAADVPGVGANLHDHPTLPIIWTTTATTDLRHLAADPAAQREWTEHGTGPASSNIGEAGAFLSTTGDDVPDVQLHTAALPFADHVDPAAPAAFTTLVTLLTPRMRGGIRLRGTDPSTPPAIDLPLWADAGDREVLRTAYRQLRELCAGTDLARLLDRPYLRDRDDLDDTAFDAYGRRWVQTLYHPVGTCAMGTGPDAVVDPELRVAGVEGVRVVDASVMPRIVRGNTNAPTIMIAERAADLLRDRVAVGLAAALPAPA